MARDKSTKKSKKNKNKAKVKTVAAEPVKIAAVPGEQAGAADKTVSPSDRRTSSSSSTAAEMHSKSAEIKPGVPARKKRTQTATAVARALLTPASVLLFLAASVGMTMAIVGLLVEGGREAIMAIGGMPAGAVAEVPLRFALLLDTLFPIFYGGGTALFFAGLQARGNRPAVRLVLLAILIGVTADLVENGFVAQALASTPGKGAVFSAVTVVKYGTLAFAGVVGSGILPPVTSAFSTLAMLVLRFGFPLIVALLVSGLGQPFLSSLAGIGFIVSLVILALYARELSSVQDWQSQ